MSNPTEKLKALFDWIITSDDSKFIDLLLLNENIEEEYKLQLAGWIPNDNLALISDCLNEEITDDIKNHMIENIDFIFDKFSEVNSQYFEQLDIHNHINPTWHNINDFYVEIGKLPMQMVNNHYVTLSDAITSDIPKNINEQKEDLFLYNNDLAIDAYKSYIPLLSFSSIDLTTELNWDKVLFLSDCSLLNVNETTISQLFSQLYDHDEEQNHQLIITMLEQYIDQITEDLLDDWLFDQNFNLLTTFCKYIFKADITIKLRAIIFKWLLLTDIDWDEEIPTFEKTIPINKSLLLSICQNLESDELKSKLINEFFETITNDDHNDIRQFFATFSNEEFLKLSQEKAMHIKLENSQTNTELHSKLLNIELISPLSEKELQRASKFDEQLIYFKNNYRVIQNEDKDFFD